MVCFPLGENIGLAQMTIYHLRTKKKGGKKWVKRAFEKHFDREEYLKTLSRPSGNILLHEWNRQLDKKVICSEITVFQVCIKLPQKRVLTTCYRKVYHIPISSSFQGFL